MNTRAGTFGTHRTRLRALAGIALLLGLAMPVSAQLSGSYTIPGSPYATLASALSDLNASGVSGAVILNIAAGYTETVPTGGLQLGSATLNASLSATNTLTIIRSGSGANPLLSGYSGGTATPASATQDGIFRIVGADYVTIDGIDLNDPNTTNPSTMEYGYALYKLSASDGCHRDTIRNCTVTLKRVNTATGTAPMVDGSAGIIVMNATPTAATTALGPTTAVGSNSFNAFHANTIQNCNIGIALIGYAAASPFTAADYNNDVGGNSAATGNSILNYGGGTGTNAAAGVRTLAQYNLNVSYNTINNNNGGGSNHAATIRAIYVNTATSANATVGWNTISVKAGSSTSTYIGIENAAGSTAASNTIRISNNTITGCTQSSATLGPFYGIFNNAATPSTLAIDSNTFSSNSTSATSGTYYPIYNTGAVPGTLSESGNMVGGVTFTATSTSAKFYGIYNSTAATSAVVTIANNLFQDVVYSGSASGEYACIYNAPTAQSLSCTISGNTFSALSTPTTAVTYLIHNSTATPTNTVSGNAVATSFSKTGAGATMYGYYSNGSPASGTTTIAGNTFSNISVSGATTFYGIYANATSTHTLAVSGNGISNISGGSSAVYGIYANSGASGSSISGNTISAISGSGSMVGISMGVTPSASMAITANTVSQLTSTGAVTMIGIGTTFGTAFQISRNTILGLEVSNSAAQVYGISFGGGTASSAHSITNNIVGDLRASLSSSASDAVRGISIASATVTTSLSVFFNTVFLNASSSGTNFSSAALYHTSSSVATTAALTMRNNILVNESVPSGSGVSVAFRRSSTELTNYTSASNNNALHAGTPGASHLIYYDGTNADDVLSAYKARVAPRDSASFTEVPPFLNTSTAPYNLHLYNGYPTQCESGGTRVTTPFAVTVDIDSALRQGETGYAGTGTSPDVGADEGEFTPLDLVGPTVAYTPMPTGPVASVRQFLNVSVTDISGVNGTSGTRPRVYYKKGGPNSSNQLFDNSSATEGWKWAEANGTVSPFSFTLDYTKLGQGAHAGSSAGAVVLGDTISYFIVAQDLSPANNVGIGFGTFANWPATVALNSSAFPVTGSSVPHSYVIGPSIADTITVGGAGARVATLKAAFDIINGLIVTGDMKVLVTGNTTESASAVLQPLNLDPPNATFGLRVQPSGGAFTVSGTIAGGLVKLNGADRVCIDGLNSGGNALTFENQSTTSGSAVVWLASQGTGSGAANDTVRSCTIIGGTNTAAAVYGIYSAGTTIGSTGTGDDNDGTFIGYNTIRKAYHGIYVAATAAGPDEGLIVTQNTIGASAAGERVMSRGLSIRGANIPSVTHNEIFDMGGASFTSSVAGIEVQQDVTNGEVSGNALHGLSNTNSTGYGVVGISVTGSSNVSGITFANNLIYDVLGANAGTGTDVTAHGIRLAGGANLKLFYNSVGMYGTQSSGSTACISSALCVTSGAVTNLDVRDNIFSNAMTMASGSKAYAVHAAAASSFGLIDYNDYFSTGANAQFGYLGLDVPTLAVWQSITGMDTSSLGVDPQFNGPTNLQPRGSSPVLGAGVPIGTVGIDYAGNTRSSTHPSIGAYEGAGDFIAPVITYTALDNTVVTSSRTFSGVSITDNTGVNGASGSRPRVYYKKGLATSSNVLVDNSSATPGWKWVEANGTTSPFTFTMDFTRLPGGSIASGDTIMYFVVAQDFAYNPNVGVNSATFASAPDSVALEPTVFPVSGSVNRFLVGANLSGTYTVGVTGNYNNLTAVASALATGCVSGDVTFLLTSGYAGTTETYPITFTRFTRLNGQLWTVTIRPDNGVTGRITGNGLTSPNTALFHLNGVDRLILDGQGRNGAGTPTGGKEWILRTQANANDVPTVLFQNDAIKNTLTYLILEGNASTPNVGTVTFSTTTGTQGNDSNTVSHCDIRDRNDGTPGLPVTAVYSAGSTGSTALFNSANTISNCDVFNFFNGSQSETSAFKLAAGTTAWTLSGNSVFQPAPVTATASAIWYPFNINCPDGNGFTVSGNYVGGSAPLCAGSAWTISGSWASRFVSYFNVGSGAASTISGNTIANFSWSTTDVTSAVPGIWCAVWLGGGLADITGNTIGAATGTGSVTVTSSGIGGAVYGIGSSSTAAGASSISGNTVAAITAAGTASTGSNIIGISVSGAPSGATVDIDGNSIGNSSANNLNAFAPTPSATAISVTGIANSSAAAVHITNNTIQNATCAYRGTSTSSQLAGISSSAGVNTITGNTVHHFSTASQNPSTGASSCLIGIKLTSSSAPATVSQNTVYSLSNTSSNAGMTVSGIVYSGAAAGNNQIARNLVHSLTVASVSNTPVSTLVGIHAAGGSNVRYANNMVRLGTDLNGSGGSFALHGILKNGTGINSFLFNSVYIGGSTVGSGSGDPSTAAFRRSASTVADTVRNNIFSTARSNGFGIGKHYAALYNSTSNVTANNNILYAPGSGGALASNDNGTTNFTSLSTWASTTGLDGASATGDPQFVNPGGAGTAVDLHLSTSNATPAEGNGSTVAALTIDYDGNTRNASTPDIGADEGAFTPADYVAPSIAFTPFGNGAVPRTLTATITDASGVPTSGSGLPVLYWKVNSGAWTSTAASSIGSNQYQFTFGGGASSGDTVRYYLVAQDLVAPPNVGASPAIGAGGFSANPPACSTPPSSPQSFVVMVGISGVIHVGASQSAPYNTLTAAVADLNAKDMTDAVTFVLDDASYGASETFPITIEQNVGMAATRRLTIKPNASQSPTISGSSSTAILKINGADYVTIDGSNNGTSTRNLTVANTSTSAATAGIWIGSLGSGAGARSCTIKNCLVSAGSGTTPVTYGIYAGSASSIGAGGDDNDSLTIQNNVVTKAYDGIFVMASASGVNDALAITGNVVGSSSGSEQIGFHGIDVSYADGASISGNEVFGIVGTVIHPRGISVGSGFANGSVTKNAVHGIKYTGASGYSARGIDVNTGSASSNVTIANNLVYDIVADSDPTSALYIPAGIAVGAASTTGGVGVLFNSVHLYGDASNGGSTYAGKIDAFYAGASASALDVRNNIFVNTMTKSSAAGQRMYAIHCDAAASAFATIGNNDYFVSGSQAVLGYLGLDLSTLAAWKSVVTADAYSVAGNPGFTSNSNLRPDSTLPESWNVNGLGTQIAGIATDYAGSARSVTLSGGAPDIGAYEFTPSSTPAAASASGAPSPGGTTSYTVAGMQVASISWGTSGTVPSAIDLRFRPGKNPPSPQQGSYGNSYSSITPTGGSGYTYDITFWYLPSLLGTISAETNIRLAKYNGAVWTVYNTSTVNTGNKTVAMTGLTSFSEFAFTDLISPLPVELVAFSAARHGYAVHLAWKTASELNTLRFVVQRRAQGSGAWTDLGSVAAQGASDRSTSYAWIDTDAASPGEFHYRLRMEDRDGTRSYSSEVRVSAMPLEGFRLAANYPNPFSQRTAISFTLPDERHVTVRVHDMAGRLVETLLDETLQAGAHVATFSAGTLATGVYRYTVIAGGEMRSGSMVVAR